MLTLPLRVAHLSDEPSSRSECQLYHPSSKVDLKGALCAKVIRLRVSDKYTDETLCQNSLRYLSNANVPLVII